MSKIAYDYTFSRTASSSPYGYAQPRQLLALCSTNGLFARSLLAKPFVSLSTAHLRRASSLGTWLRTILAETCTQGYGPIVLAKLPADFVHRVKRRHNEVRELDDGSDYYLEHSTEFERTECDKKDTTSMASLPT